jgi:hypothetical protein
MRSVFQSVSTDDGGPPPPRRSTTIRNQKILLKLQKSNIQLDCIQKEDLQQWSSILTSKDSIKEYYMSFTPDLVCQTVSYLVLFYYWLYSHFVTTQLDQLLSLETKITTHNRGSSLVDIDVDYYKSNKDLIEQLFVYGTGKSARVRTCIVLRESVCHAIPANRKTMKNLLSPILNTDEQQVRSNLNNFGKFYCAVLVGPFLLEWDRSCSLCIPKLCVGNLDELFASDLGLFSDTSLPAASALDTVATMVAEWNAKKTYDAQDCNSQHFVEELWSRFFNASIALSVREFFDQQFDLHLRLTGECDCMNLKITKKLQSVLPSDQVAQDYIRFKSHEELDDFVRIILSEEPHFFTKYPNEAMVLKTIDRVFWLRDLVDLSGNVVENEDCPFGNPSQQGWRVAQQNTTNVVQNYLIFFQK